MIPDHHAELVELLAALNTGDAYRAWVAARRLADLLHPAAYGAATTTEKV